MESHLDPNKEEQLAANTVIIASDVIYRELIRDVIELLQTLCCALLMVPRLIPTI